MLLKAVIASLRKVTLLQVVASIHQPSGDITQLFDDFLLLSLGRLLYCGAWTKAGQFFDDLGYRHDLHAFKESCTSQFL